MLGSMCKNQTARVLHSFESALQITIQITCTLYSIVHEKKNSAFGLYTALIFNVVYIVCVFVTISEYTHNNWVGCYIECVQLELNSNDFSILNCIKKK